MSPRRARPRPEAADRRLNSGAGGARTRRAAGQVRRPPVPGATYGLDGGEAPPGPEGRRPAAPVDPAGPAGPVDPPAGSAGRADPAAPVAPAGRGGPAEPVGPAEGAGAAEPGTAGAEDARRGSDGWGAAWLRALESSGDPARLERGRAYARGGSVAAVRVVPGRITAYVHGSRPRPYRAELRLPVLSDEAWEGFLDAVCGRPDLVAALLDGGIPRAVADRAARAGAPLPPEPGELRPACTCPDRGRMCKHTAALGYAVAGLLDVEPFALLLARGRDEESLRDELARRSARPRRPAAPVAAPPRRAAALPARGVYTARERPPLPEPLPIPELPGEPGPFPEVAGGPEPDALAFLAVGAAARAHEALRFAVHPGSTGPAGGRARAEAAPAVDPLPELSLWHDTVRLAATHPDLAGRRSLSPLFAELARAAGRTAPELARAAAAWRQGGPAGLEVLETVWDPPAGDFDRGRSALVGQGLTPVGIHRNHLTHRAGGHQLRYGRDGRWYPYRADPLPAGAEAEEGPAPGDWWPEGPAASDPLTALAALTARTAATGRQ